MESKWIMRTFYFVLGSFVIFMAGFSLYSYLNPTQHPAEAEDRPPTIEEQLQQVVYDYKDLDNSIKKLNMWYPEDMEMYENELTTIESGIQDLRLDEADGATPEQVESTNRLADAMEAYRNSSIIYAKGESGESGMSTDTIQSLEMLMLTNSNAAYDIVHDEIEPLL